MLTELAPDVALLQEVNGFPENILSTFDIRFLKAVGKTGKPQRFGTAILVKGKIIDELPLSSKYSWVNKELAHFAGNLVACLAEPTGHAPLKIVSVYSPAWPVDKARLKGIDVTPVKLQNNPDVWVTELVWSALMFASPTAEDRWIVGGDLNSSETFDYMWKGGPRGNRDILDRMSNLGFNECLRSYQGCLTPTFRNPRNGEVIHQMDHMFVTKSLVSSLKRCWTGDPTRVFGESLSDHLPIIADFLGDSDKKDWGPTHPTPTQMS
jgi:exonuclease III